MSYSHPFPYGYIHECYSVVASTSSTFLDLLGGQAPEEKTDGPSVIVGKGRLGTALAGMGMGDDIMIGRGEGIPEYIPGAGGEGEFWPYTVLYIFSTRLNLS